MGGHQAGLHLPIVVLGGGGHARVVVDLLRASGETIAGLCTRDGARGERRHGLPIVGDDAAIVAAGPRTYALALGVGSVGDSSIRIELWDRFRRAGFSFPPLVHPTAYVSDDATLGEGSQIFAGAVVQPGAALGPNVIVNSRASIDHDCHIGAHAHISPGAILCGNVTVGERAHVGAGAVVIQGRTIAAGAIVGAGSTVIADVAAGTTVVGVPAKARV